MELHREWVQTELDGETIDALFVRPKQLTEGLPAVIVTHDMFGVGRHFPDIAERLAKSNYLVVVPDLFSRRRPRSLLQERLDSLKSFYNKMPPAAWWNEAERERLTDLEPDADQLRETIKALPMPIYGAQPEKYNEMRQSLRAWSAYLRRSGAISVGCIGYCIGGALTFDLAAIDPSLNAAVVFYGSAPAEEKLQNIQSPILGLYGEQDPNITGKVPEVKAAMDRLGKRYEYYIYENTGHAFFENERHTFHPKASREAWARTLMFLNQHL